MKLKYLVLLILLVNTLHSQAQSKKDLLKKNEALRNTNVKLEKSNLELNIKLKNLAEKVERLEKELEETKAEKKDVTIAKDKALLAKDEAIKSKEEAMKAQIESLKSKEALFEEKKRMEIIFAKESKGKSSLKQLSVSGRYYDDQKKSEDAYIDLYEDGTTLFKAPKEKGNPINSVSGKYNLRGNKITVVLSIFTMPHVVEGTIENNRLTIVENGKTTFFTRR